MHRTVFGRAARAAATLLTAASLAAPAGVAWSQTPTLGPVTQGSLAQGDPTLDSGEFQDTYQVRGRAGQQLVVRMRSTAFDPYLMIRGPGNFSEDNDDAPGGGVDSELNVRLPADGTYQIVATSFRPGERGAYVVELGDRAQPMRGEAPVPAPARGTAALQAGSQVRGELARGDGARESGQLADSYILRGRRGEQLELRMSSTVIDPYLEITGPGGFSAFNDDDVEQGTTDSRLIVSLPADGEYRVTASSYEQDETGAYQLAVAATETVDPEEGVSSAGAEGLSAGREQRGELAQGDETLRSGEFVDRFRFRGRAGQRLRLEARSSTIDTYLILVSPTGEQEDNDDASQTDTNARLETELVEDGEYTVLVTSYRAGESGEYRLNLADAGSAPGPRPRAPGEDGGRAQAPGGTGRVFAVLVGVSDYGGAANNLNYTDEDATKLRDTLSRAGVLGQGSVTLTNAQATVGAVRRAFADVSRRAGPGDVFLFFFSGHGDQNPAARGSGEPDDTDESIVLRDGSISDDEMARMFAQIRARTSILAIDACYAGGFARDVVTRPGVMGLFSSEEDLTSAVAEKFRAGGYLSHFLRTGLAGEADGNRDRAITAGELSTYLRRQWVAERVGEEEATTADGQSNYQNLVVERGGVRLDDVILG